VGSRQGDLRWRLAGRSRRRCRGSPSEWRPPRSTGPGRRWGPSTGS